MKISTRILITLVLSLAIFGSTIIGISYVNTLKNEKMFLALSVGKWKMFLC